MAIPKLKLISSIKHDLRDTNELGDIQALAKSVEDKGWVQPVGVTPDDELIFGRRRLGAVKFLGRKCIPVHVIDLQSIASGKLHANKIRSDFMLTDRVVIAHRIIQNIEETPSAEPVLLAGAEFAADHDVEFEQGKYREVIVRRLGFSKFEEYCRVKHVVDDGIPELIDALDRGEIKVKRASSIASLPREVQLNALEIERSNSTQGRSDSRFPALQMINRHLEKNESLRFQIQDRYSSVGKMLASVDWDRARTQSTIARLRKLARMLERLATEFEQSTHQMHEACDD